jgi:cyclic pyranopterin phosphate synthase
MLDAFGRNVHYLRLSLTERCPLRCLYCKGGAARAEQTAQELTLSEIARYLRALIPLGITKVRLTGGEPLQRGDLEEIVRSIAAHPEICDLALTSNGQGLSARLPALAGAGLKRVNLSLDALDEARFFALTGGRVDEVLRALDTALALGLPVKLNCVLLRGQNEEELPALLALAQKLPVTVRFIERMPLGVSDEQAEPFLPSETVLSLAPTLRPVPADDPSDAAVLYTAPDWRGRVGLISPLSHRFCAACSRLRITSDGKLRMCLGVEQEVDLRAVPPETLPAVLQQAIWQKPKGHAFDRPCHGGRTMNRLGG